MIRAGRDIHCELTLPGRRSQRAPSPLRNDDDQPELHFEFNYHLRWQLRKSALIYDSIALLLGWPHELAERAV